MHHGGSDVASKVTLICSKRHKQDVSELESSLGLIGTSRYFFLLPECPPAACVTPAGGAALLRLKGRGAGILTLERARIFPVWRERAPPSRWRGKTQASGNFSASDGGINAVVR